MAGPAPAPTIRQRLEYNGLVMVFACVARLPFRALHPLARLIGALVYYGDWHGAAVARANIQSAFGDTVTPARIRQIARCSYQNFARTMLELFWSPNLTEPLSEKIAHWDRHDLAEPGYDPSQAVMYVCLHYSNFEWLGQFGSYTVYRGPVVAQRLKNPLLGPLIDKLRASTGHYIIPQERAMIRMFKHLQVGGKFSMLGDLTLDPREGSVLITAFGGLQMSVTQMPAALALRTGAKIVPSECRVDPNGGYHMICYEALKYPPDATAAEITQMCWDALEPTIHQHPECWLWSYKHWRYKPSDDTSGRYPFYANVAKRFDKLLRTHRKA